MRRISSGWTIVFKVLGPLFFVSISIVLVLALFAHLTEPFGDAVIGTLLTVAATVFFCWWGARLKVVSLDDQNLYASNLLKEISIPLSQIVTVDSVLGGWPVTVRLKSKSEFGDAIRFLSPWRPLLFLEAHPILEELRQLVSRAQKSPSVDASRD